MKQNNIQFLSMFVLIVSMALQITALTPAVQASKDVCTVYVHGFTGNPTGAESLKAAFSNQNNFQAPALPDTKQETDSGLSALVSYLATYWKKNVNRSQAFMAQGEDISTLAAGIPTQDSVFFGICRGGSLAVNCAAEHNPTNLKAMVLEGSYTGLPDAFRPALAKCGIPDSWDESIVRTCLPRYPKGAVTPIQNIEKIKNKALPVLILHSREDETVPFTHALQLYKTFKDNGFNNAYIAALKGRHAYLFKEDTAAYLTAVHTFYKHHNLPYNAVYATGNMNDYSYDLDKAQAEINYQKSALQELTVHNRRLISCMVGSGIVCAVAARLLWKSFKTHSLRVR